MIHFNDCDVIINGTGLIADSASLTENNSLEASQYIGYSMGKLIPNGAVICNIEVNYKPNINKEPNIAILADLKKIPPVVNLIDVEIGGLQSCVFLKSYSLFSAPNEPSRATASYLGFTPVSGGLASKRETIDYGLSPESIIHGWSTIVNYNSTGWMESYQFSYSVDLDYTPIYSLGKKEPTQVVFQGGSEKIEVLKDNYYKIDFSGSGMNIVMPSNSSFSLYGLSKEYDSSSPGIVFSLNNASVKSSKLEANLNDFVKTNISIEGRF